MARTGAIRANSTTATARSPLDLRPPTRQLHMWRRIGRLRSHIERFPEENEANPDAPQSWQYRAQLLCLPLSSDSDEPLPIRTSPHTGDNHMPKAVGIDLGTTNSVVAVLEAGDPVVI